MPTQTHLIKKTSAPKPGNGHATGAEPSAPITHQPIANHPLASVLGVFKDDPEFDALMEQIHESRRQRTAEDSGAAEDMSEGLRVSA